MQITQEQYEKIAKYLPKQRGNVSMSNLRLINAILYVTENGCKWRALPEAYGNWHTIYVRMNRWSKNGVLSRVFAALQTEGIIQINVFEDCVHPDLCRNSVFLSLASCPKSGCICKDVKKRMNGFGVEWGL